MMLWRFLIFGWCIIGVIMLLLVLSHCVNAYAAADRPCTQADVARFEAMFPRGSYHSDPRTQMTLHYLGTKVVNGTCLIAIRPAS
jgi:hypothetical protein